MLSVCSALKCCYVCVLACVGGPELMNPQQQLLMQQNPAFIQQLLAQQRAQQQQGHPGGPPVGSAPMQGPQ